MAEASAENRVCRDCGAAWTLTAAAAEWFRVRRLHLPQRCRACRALRKDDAQKARAGG